MNTRANLNGPVVDLDMAGLIASRDWSRTPLGPAAAWPQSLKTIVSVLVNAPLAMIVLWGPDLIQVYNAAYAEICGERHPEALGQPTRACWPEVWDFTEPIYRAVQRGEVRAFERQLLSIRRAGVLQDVWFDLTYSPVRDETDRVAGILVTVVDATHHVQMERMTAAAAAEGARLRFLFERAPGFVAIMKGPDHVFEFANQSYLQQLGGRAVIGLPVREVMPETIDQGFFELLDQVYATGASHVGTSVPLRLDPPGGGLPIERYLDFVYAPMFDLDGAVIGVFLQGTDATDRILAEERQKLFNNELNHRVKNTLATVLSLAMLARKSATTVEAFTQSFTDRIGAMAITHDLLTAKGWAPVPVSDLLTLELAPYVSDARQVELHCDDLLVAADAAVNISLIVHELLTNAAKYGALATPEGRLKVTCRRLGTGAVLVWRETVGHPLAAPGAAGFGTRLISRLARGLGGDSEISLTPAGQHARITFATLATGGSPGNAPTPP